MWVIAPQAQANMVNVPVPIAQYTVHPAAPTTAPMLITGGAPNPMPPPPPGSAPGSVMGFDNMSDGDHPLLPYHQYGTMHHISES